MGRLSLSKPYIKTAYAPQAEISRRERCLKAGGSLRSTIKGGRGRCPPTTVGWQKTKNAARRFFGLIKKHECGRQTDRRTDRQNYDSQDRGSIPSSRGKN